ncbi:hemolysin family protein [Paenibacillus guangzhouensis]|uniref:hemolysin family protein n=1 Tax=Paenibacillus guangzhouensis TaxID=1473112 RepID=UPI001266C7F8|nr:hemolysin family protein [Paenibacillus guangzhouensis]
MPILNLFLVALLIIATAFFVATEFAVIKLRPSRVDQLVLEGRKNAMAVKIVTSNLDGYLSACQLGITITALGLGWLGEPTVEKLLHPLFEQLGIADRAASIISFIIAFLLVTYLHVVLGELAPKTFAIRKAETISLLTARPIIYFYKIMYPLIWLFNGSANAIVRLFGLKPAKEHDEAHSEQELQIILSESYESGKINTTEYGYVSKIFAFDNLLAREIMVPRTDMICLDADQSMEENLKIIQREQYTRFPVISGSKDNIIGMIHTKQFIVNKDLCDDTNIKPLIHNVLTVSEAIPIKTLLKRMQQERTHIAILIDEYGGTSGMITIEDILEEIVGEIRDEFDTDEQAPVEKINDDHYILDGMVPLSQVNDLLNTHYESEHVDTISGWLFEHNPDLSRGGEWQYEDFLFTIKKADKHRIRRVEVKKINVEASE